MVIPLISGFILGVAIGSFFHVSLAFFLVLTSIGVIFFVYRYFVENNNRKVITFCAIAIFGILFGLVRVNFSDLYAKSSLYEYVGQKIEAIGVIVDEPDVRDSNTKLTIILSSPAQEKILVTVPLYHEYSYGDKVELSNLVLEEPKDIESSGRIFDYKGYLRVRGIWYTSRFTQVKLVSSGNGNYLKALLFKIKHAFTNALDNALPEPESSFMSGLLLGNKQSLGKDLLKEFQRSGRSHVVVLSGYNITIVAESIMALLAFLPKTFSFSFGAVSIVLFTILSG